MITYVILFNLTIFQSLLKTIKEKTRIQGYDKISDILGGILAFVSMVVPLIAIQGSLSTKQLLIKAFVVGLSAYIGNILATIIFNRISKDKTYQFKIKFYKIDNCINSYKLLKNKDIAVHKQKDNLGLTVFSDTKEESNVILDTIEGKYKNYKIVELIDNVKNI